MRLPASLFPVLMVCVAVAARGQGIDILVSLNVMPDQRLESKAYVVYAGSSITPPRLDVYQAIIDRSCCPIAGFSGSGSSPYSHSLTSSSAGVPPNCYVGRATVTASDGASDSLPSSDVCFQGPPTPPPDSGPTNPTDEGGCPYSNCNSPIVINLSHGPYQLVGASDPVEFDIDADGSRDRIAWTATALPMAFLALDRNGNGRIDDGAELFGNHTTPAAANGFEALALDDTNGDGVIDPRDPIWSSLLLWTDMNHDGRSQSSELMPLSESAVTAIGSSCHWSGRRDGSGNTFRYEGRVWLGDRPRPVYDVYFLSVR